MYLVHSDQSSFPLLVLGRKLATPDQVLEVTERLDSKSPVQPIDNSTNRIVVSLSFEKPILFLPAVAESHIAVNGSDIVVPASN